MPTELFYNTNIGIYAFILSKNKRKERENKIQLINAVDFYEELCKSLGKKRRELSTEDISNIVNIYTNFEEGKFCKIFDRDEFLYKEYAVYQALQRTGKITLETIKALQQGSWYASNFIVEETVYEELNSKIIKIEKLITSSAGNGSKLLKEKSEKELLKLKKKKEKLEGDEKLGCELIEALKKSTNGKEYKDFAKLKNHLKTILKSLTITSARLDKLAYEMSEMDKTAVIQKDKKGKVIYDPATKDSEIIKFNQNTEEYFKNEVYPHIPDAHYEWEGRSGAEFPFTRYFYEYKEPEKAEDLLAQFVKIEEGINKKIAELKNEY